MGPVRIKNRGEKHILPPVTLSQSNFGPNSDWGGGGLSQHGNFYTVHQQYCSRALKHHHNKKQGSWATSRGASATKATLTPHVRWSGLRLTEIFFHRHPLHIMYVLPCIRTVLSYQHLKRSPPDHHYKLVQVTSPRHCLPIFSRRICTTPVQSNGAFNRSSC